MRGDVMKHRYFYVLFVSTLLLQSLLTSPRATFAQGTLADYERADNLRNRLQGLAINIPERANWIGTTSRFWYRKSVEGGNEFVLVDAETLTKKPAFDHERLAASLSSAAGEKYTALKLPFNAISFVDNEKAIEFTIGEFLGFGFGPTGGATGPRWKCDLSDYSCKKLSEDTQRGRGQFNLQARGIPGPQYDQGPSEPKMSPDGKWEALINNYNVVIRTKGKKEVTRLSFDGSEGNSYTLQSIAWSPDSSRLVAYRVRSGYHRRIQYVESSPTD